MIPDGLPIRTARLELRCLDASAASGPYAHWFEQDDVTEFLETRAQPGRADLEAFIDRCNRSETDVLLGIFRVDNARHIGNLKIGPLVRRHARTTFGIVIGDKASWGQGYAREAIAAAAELSFARLGVEKITAGCYAANFGSRGAFRGAGFHEEAVLRRHARDVSGSFVDVIEMARFHPGTSNA